MLLLYINQIYLTRKVVTLCHHQYLLSLSFYIIKGPLSKRERSTNRCSGDFIGFLTYLEVNVDKGYIKHMIILQSI